MASGDRQSLISVPPVPKGAVLVVDDDDATRLLICRWLKGADLTTVEATNGEHALTLVSANPDEFDAILLDVMMPGLDGYEVVRRLKADDATALVPVVLFTAHANTDADIVRSVECGAVDHIAKPFSGPVLVAKIRAVCERSRADRRLRSKLASAQEHAVADALTKLFNRLAFDRRIKQEAEFARRHARPLALAAFDLDHFKSINDTYGHDAGDRVLVHVADATRSILRADDAAFRIGGEEFVVVFRDTTRADATAALGRLRDALVARPIVLAGDSKVVTFSGGVAVADASNDFSVDDLLQRADEALYRAKRAGRDRVELA